MRVRKIAPKVLQLLTEWTETFPYDFRDERMMRSLKELTHRLASGDEVDARLFTSQTSSKIMRAGIQICGVALVCRRHMQQSYKHKQIFADGSAECCRVKLWWQSSFWGWMSWVKSLLYSWARWVFFLLSLRLPFLDSIWIVPLLQSWNITGFVCHWPLLCCGHEEIL